nr:MAG TPA: hypothetical protein [Caudoviricetes sp.]
MVSRIGNAHLPFTLLIKEFQSSETNKSAFSHFYTEVLLFLLLRRCCIFHNENIAISIKLFL